MTRPPHTHGETQTQRTAMSWQRLGLGVMAVAGLIGHAAVRHEHPVLLALAGGAALLALAVLGGLAPVRYRQVRRTLLTGEGAVSPGLMAAAATVVALVGLASLTTLLLLR